jgi:plastocyanin
MRLLLMLWVIVPACLFPEGEQAGTLARAPPEAGGGAGASSATIRLESLSFSPPKVTIAVGGAVVFENFDPSVHLMRDGSPESPGTQFKKGLGQGQSFSVTFTQPGEYAFYCANHPKVMRDGRIIVR